ncbi:hypothetical protein HBH53_189160 [Parastagonospora nodorum]|nr:hypothetical protein HBH53_189160 [Parastagonospora nodorum]KAH4800169.1 hypothetical protein HBH61_215560 [Parastagonospora nodorum]KAH4900101.1 hypothetical protein HBH74_185840 [Parastagonospora nodorum]KAH4935297.1 hypothetical protein HBH73_175790 [Parastagonospora nodorum]KAH4943757.1 hypothetical protein HBI79_022320 [Parastagonospora nodorum]
MLILLLFTFIYPATASYPACGRRARIDPISPNTADLLLEPAVQMDYAHCSSLCGLTSECGGYASTAKKQASDWCFVFRKGLSYEDIFGAGDEQWSLEDGVPVGFWEADCPKRTG